MTIIKFKRWCIFLILAWLPGYFGNTNISFTEEPGPFEWVRIWDVYCGSDVAISPEGGIYVAGYFCEYEGEINLTLRSGAKSLNSSGCDDGFLICAGQDGFIESALSLGGPGCDQALGVTVDDRGEIFITGYFSGKMDFDPGPKEESREALGYEDAFVLKLDSHASYEWVATFGGVGGDAKGYDIVVEPTGEVVLCGSFQGPMDFDPGDNEDVKTSIDDPDGGISYADGFVIKLTPEGTYCWGIVIGSEGLDGAFKVAMNSNKDIFILGNFICDSPDTLSVFGKSITGKYQVTTNGYDDIFLVMLDSNGDPCWLSNFGGVSDDCAAGLAVDSTAGIFITGSLSAPDYTNHIKIPLTTASDYPVTFLANIDFAGKVRWINSWGPRNSAWAASCAVSSNGFAYVLGSFSGAVDFDPGTSEEVHSSRGGWNDNRLFITKYNVNGQFKGAWTWKGDITGAAMNIISKDIDTIYVLGQSPYGATLGADSDANTTTATKGFGTFLAKFATR